MLECDDSGTRRRQLADACLRGRAILAASTGKAYTLAMQVLFMQLCKSGAMDFELTSKSRGSFALGFLAAHSRTPRSLRVGSYRPRTHPPDLSPVPQKQTVLIQNASNMQHML